MKYSTEKNYKLYLFVLAKKDRAIEYCRVATEYNLANGHKGFKYLFIPHDQMETNSSFDNLKNRFLEE